MESVNASLKTAIIEEAKYATDWALNDLVLELYWWVDFFNIAFFKDQPVPAPVLSFEKTKISSPGHYVSGRNAFGITDTININRIFLGRPLWEILLVLLHEMTHSWQAHFAKPSKSWFHNKEFRIKMKEFGTNCNPKGHHEHVGDPFVFLLKQHGVDFEGGEWLSGKIARPRLYSLRGTSKLGKWQCPCGQRARVGRKEFFATCDLCCQQFIHVP